MKRNRLGSCTIAVGLAAIPASTPAMAGIEITATEVGGDVIFEGGGSLDTTLWTFVQSGPFDAAIKPDDLFIAGAGGDIDIVNTPVNFAGPSLIGPGTDFILADAAAGDKIGISWFALELGIPTGYTSGDPLNGSATYIGQTFASLGVAEGTYTYTWDTADGRGDYFTINIVPAPGTIALLGLAGLFGKRRRRVAYRR